MFRDILWTVIIVWLIYRLVDIFRGAGQKKKYAYGQQNQNSYTGDSGNSSTTSNTTFTKKDVKSAIQKRADKEGEYVDFEEIK